MTCLIGSAATGVMRVFRLCASEDSRHRALPDGRAPVIKTRFAPAAISSPWCHGPPGSGLRSALHRSVAAHGQAALTLTTARLVIVFSAGALFPTEGVLT